MSFHNTQGLLAKTGKGDWVCRVIRENVESVEISIYTYEWLGMWRGSEWQKGRYDGYNQIVTVTHNEMLSATRDQGYKTFSENLPFSLLYLQNNVFEPREDNPFFKHTVFFFFEGYLGILESHLVHAESNHSDDLKYKIGLIINWHVSECEDKMSKCDWFEKCFPEGSLYFHQHIIPPCCKVSNFDIHQRVFIQTSLWNT